MLKKQLRGEIHELVGKLIRGAYIYNKERSGLRTISVLEI
jgi:hypothetical protein